MFPGEQPAMIVRLAETMGMPALGSPDMPTLGSMGHRYGNCKPCAFMHTKVTDGMGTPDPNPRTLVNWCL